MEIEKPINPSVDINQFSAVKIIYALNEVKAFIDKDIIKLYKMIKRSKPTLINKVINKLKRHKETKIKELSKPLLDKALGNVRTIFFYLNYLPNTKEREVLGEIIQTKYLELVSFRNKYLISLGINVDKSLEYLDQLRSILIDIDTKIFDEVKKEIK